MDNTHFPTQQGRATISRMTRGLVACAECKRMKLKCDKKVCLSHGSSSISLAQLYIGALQHLRSKRMLSHLVSRPTTMVDITVAQLSASFPSLQSPTGTLSSRQASRAILVEGSSGRRSQDVIAGLRERNLQLEDALAIAHSHISKDIHPLLAESPKRRPQDDLDVDKVTEVLGTLTVGDAGEFKYFGHSAMTEPLHQAISAEDKLTSSRVLPRQDLDSVVESFSTQIPVGSPLSMESFVSTILRDLPPKNRAWTLCRSYYEGFPMYTMPIQQTELVQGYLRPIYKYLEDSRANQNLALPLTALHPHRCALVFFTFALGAWLDLTQEHYWVEADRYFQIGISCLSMQSILYSPEVASVEALYFFISYNELRGVASTSTISPSWTILSLACKIGQGLGLHRDPARWDLDNTTVQHRRWLYWELVSMEVLHGLLTGRPLSIRPSYVDTELPDDVVSTDAHGELLQGFFRWKHAAVRDCYLGVAETLLAATPVKYEVVLELDRKVRAKEIPAHLNRILVNAEDGPNLTLPEFMHTCILGAFRSMMILAIHRSHLTEALKDLSANPLKSRYAPSFLASYRAASWIVKSFYGAHRRFPALFARLYYPWTGGFFFFFKNFIDKINSHFLLSLVLTAAMVLGSIAIHAPSSLVGNGPLEELRVASSMFREAAAQAVSQRTKNGAKIVQNILAKAEEAQVARSVSDADVVHSGIAIPSTNYGDDELAIFGGQARLFAVDSISASPQSREGSSHILNSPTFSSGSLEDVHPSLIDFLNRAPKTQVASSTTFREIQMTPFEPHFVSPFHDVGFMPPQLEKWESTTLPTPVYQYNFGNIGGPSPSGSQTPDTFENYLTLPEPVDLGPEPSSATPWQDFMIQHSLT
ncbi:hypothetical protein DL96DRAFT_1816810 [Flagelloscypha sp. PMI_526]|nr:hypothetical protein DL96DRAFT_1816810 [Flagelloscypha sp. PMI_526]